MPNFLSQFGFVKKSGDTMTGTLEIQGSLRLSDPGWPNCGGVFEPSGDADGYIFLRELSLQNRGQLIARETPLVLYQGVDPLSHTGNTDETPLIEVPVPMGFMGKNGMLFVSLTGRGNGVNDSKAVRIKFGDTTLMTITVPSGNDVYWSAELYINNNDSYSAQKSGGFYSIGSVSYDGISNIDSSIDTLYEQKVKIHVQLANAADSVHLDNRIFGYCYRK